MSIFGGNTGITYEQLQQRRKMADQLRQQNSARPPQNVGQGIHAIARALVARGIDKQNTTRTKELKDQYSGVWGDITGSLSGGQPTATPFNPSMSGASSGGGQGGGAGMERYRNAIASIESDGSGGYQAIGPTHPEMGRALGRYQVMEANLPQWSREAVGREVTPEEYLASPEIQDAIFDRKFGGYIDQFGEQGAAQAWFAGPGGVGKTGRKDSLGTSVGEYTNKFQGAMGGGQGSGVRTAQAGGIDPSIAQMAQLLSAPDEFMPPGQKAVVQALLQRKLQASDPMRALDMQMKQAQLDQMQNPQADVPSSVQELQWRAEQSGLQPGTPEYQEFIMNGGGDPATYRALDMQAQAAGLQPGTPEYENFMATRGAGNQAYARQAGTNEADIATGGAATSARKSGEIAAEAGKASYDAYREVMGNMSNINEAIQAIDSGAKSGMAQKYLPNISLASATLENAMNRMGLDVIGSVTFGALSEGEMRLAMDTAVPRDLSPPELREWLVNKRNAQEKAAQALYNAGKYLSTPGNTLAKYMEENPPQVQQEASPPPSAPGPTQSNSPDAGAGMDFSGMGVAEIGQIDINNLSNEQMDALEKRMQELGL